MISAQQFRRTSRRRVAVGAAALTAGALVLTGCGAGSGDDDLQQITMVSFLPLESFTFTPEMYAYAGGYFERHGLDVEMQAVQGSAAAVQSILGGAALITRASSIDVFPTMEDGQPIRAVGTMAYKSNLRVVSTDENPVESPADMVGEVMGMGSIGGTSERMLDLALDAGGVDRDDVVRQAVPVTGATYQLVKQGELAGYIVSLDTSIAIGTQNDDAVVTDAGLSEAPDMQTWLVNESSIEDEQDAANITAFMAAIREAVQDVIDDAENDFENVIQTLRDDGEFNFAALDDDAIAQEALEFYITETWVDPVSDTPLLVNNYDSWTSTYDTYVDAGFLEGGHDPSDWMTDDLLPTD